MTDFGSAVRNVVGIGGQRALRADWRAVLDLVYDAGGAVLDSQICRARCLCLLDSRLRAVVLLFYRSLARGKS